MRKTGAELLRYALEQVGVRYTFGIPGVHTTEVYDQLNSSKTITPILVTHECCGAFMADAVSRTSDSIGTLVIVPAAGITHAASGIGEAGLDGIPMLIVSGGIHSESDFKFQLHDIDQHTLLKPLTKASFKILHHDQVVDTVYQAYQIATEDEPGPVYIELPYNIANFKGAVSELPCFKPTIKEVLFTPQEIYSALELIKESRQVGLFVGWGAVKAQKQIVELAELLGAPVATTLQGLSAFPYEHPLQTGMGIGKYAVPASEVAFETVDCLIAIGTRFSEIATGSYGINVPENLIHIDINKQVFNANYPATITIEGDSQIILNELLTLLRDNLNKRDSVVMSEKIAESKEQYKKEWNQHSCKRINPYLFFTELYRAMDEDAFIVTDDGNHTFLTAELLPINKPRHFISPSDFNAMGYGVPAAIAVKLTHPEQQVIAIVGDGAFLMTGMELLTAKHLSLGVIVFMFNDGELSQISQAQEIPYNRKTCTVIPGYRPEGIALAAGAEYFDLVSEDDIESVIADAIFTSSQGKPVLVTVNIDYSKRTRFTEGVVKTNLQRFSASEKLRAVSRALFRKVTG